MKKILINFALCCCAAVAAKAAATSQDSLYASFYPAKVTSKARAGGHLIRDDTDDDNTDENDAAACDTFVSTSVNLTNHDCIRKCDDTTAPCQVETIVENDHSEWVPTGTCFSKEVMGWVDLNEWTARWTVVESVPSPNECQYYCQVADDCVWFMWAVRTSNCALVTRNSTLAVLDGSDCPKGVCSGSVSQPTELCTDCETGGSTGDSTKGCVWRSYHHITGPKVCYADKETTDNFCNFDVDDMPSWALPDGGGGGGDDTTSTSTASTKSTASTASTATTIVPDSTTAQGTHTPASPWKTKVAVAGGAAAFFTAGVAYTLRARKKPEPVVESRLDDMGDHGNQSFPVQDLERPFWD